MCLFGIICVLLSMYLQVVCLAERDFYPPGIPLTHGGRPWSKWIWLLQGSLGSCLYHSSPCVTWNLFFNLKPWLSAVSSPHDPPTIPHYLQGEGNCLSHHLSPTDHPSPSQTFPFSPPGLLMASQMQCTCPVWTTFQVSIPTFQSPMYLF